MGGEPEPCIYIYYIIIIHPLLFIQYLFNDMRETGTILSKNLYLIKFPESNIDHFKFLFLLVNSMQLKS